MSSSSSFQGSPCDLSGKEEEHLFTACKRKVDRTEYWKRKNMEGKARKRARNEVRRRAEQEEWASLTAAQQEERRRQAVMRAESRRQAQSELHRNCLSNMQSLENPRVIFDLSFEKTMKESDVRRTIEQLKISYSVLRKSEFPLVPLFLGACEGSIILPVLQAYEGFKKYPPSVKQDHWLSLFPKDRIVFLTSDSDKVLTSVDPGFAYVIGAFVDHNSMKNVTFQAASELGVATARLPIKESLQRVGNLSQVLTINHVVEVLCLFMKTGKWGEAFSVLPTRRC